MLFFVFNLSIPNLLPALSLLSLPGGPLLVSGCSDGSVRLFDLRLSSHESRIMTWREHSSYVLGADLHRPRSLRHQHAAGVQIISGR